MGKLLNKDSSNSTRAVSIPTSIPTYTNVALLEWVWHKLNPNIRFKRNAKPHLWDKPVLFIRIIIFFPITFGNYICLFSIAFKFFV